MELGVLVGTGLVFLLLYDGMHLSVLVWGLVYLSLLYWGWVFSSVRAGAERICLGTLLELDILAVM